MSKYSKYQLSLGSFLIFSITFSLAYFSDNYKAFLADSLEGMEDSVVSEQQVSIVTDLEIQVVEQPLEEPVEEFGYASGESEELVVSEAVGIMPIDPIVIENPAVPEDCQLMIAGVEVGSDVNSEQTSQEPDSAVEIMPEALPVQEVEPVIEVEPEPESVVPVEDAVSVESEVPVIEELPEPESVVPVEEAVPVESEVPVIEESPAPADLGVSSYELGADIATLSTGGTESNVYAEELHEPVDCQKYLDAMKQNVPVLEVIPDVVEKNVMENIVEREFSLVQMNEEIQMNELKSNREAKLKELILDYYFQPHDEGDDYMFLGNHIFYLRFDLDDIYQPETLAAGEDFVLIDQYVGFIEEKNLYYIGLVFSKYLDFDSLAPDNFMMEDSAGAKVVPKRVFAYKNEAVLLYESEQPPDVKLLKLDTISALRLAAETGVAPDLSGYFYLQEEDDSYIEVVSEAKTEYEAYIGDDITFAAAKMSFGEFNQYAPSDSTIAIDIGNAGSLNNECAILVFGNDLMHDGGVGQIPADGLRLISQSNGGVPIDSDIVKDFELEKSKAFIGFVYLKDLEIVNDSYAFYLNLSVPAGLDKGAYRSDFSFEVFCPNGGNAMGPHQ